MSKQKTEIKKMTDDEIDLRELIIVLWQGKWWIVLSMLVVVLIALGYIVSASPVYRVAATVTQPVERDLSDYNLHVAEYSMLLAGAGQRAPHMMPREAFKAFLTAFTNPAYKKEIFNELQRQSSSGSGHAAQSWQTFDSALDIHINKEETTAEIFMESSDPENSAQLINEAIRQAEQLGKEVLLAKLQNEIAQAIRQLEMEKKSLENSARIDLEIQLEQLERALEIAQKIGLSEPYRGVFADLQGGTAYMRGTRALQAEIEVLGQQLQEQSYLGTPGLGSIDDRLQGLNAISIEPERLAVLEVVNQAQPPKTPIRPKKQLVLAVAILLGLMLGVFIVLVKHAFRDFDLHGRANHSRP